MATEVKGGLGLLKRVALLIRVKKATGLSRRKAKKVRDCMLSCGESCGHDEICSGYCEVMDMFSDEYENVD